jgi:hypothetical protein
MRQPPERDERQNRALPDQFWFELVGFGSTVDDEDSGEWGSVASFAPALRARFTAAEKFLLHAALPFAAVTAVPPGSGSSNRVNAFRVGNPSFSAAWRLPLGAEAWLAPGIGFALPVATLGSGDTPDLGANAALELASAARGYSEPWMYLPDMASLYVPMEIGWDLPRTHLSFQLIPVHGFAMRAGGSDSNFIVTGARIQQGLSRAFSLGCYLRSTFNLNDSVSDNAQVSLEPFAELAARYFFANLGYLINLDPPRGPSEPLFVWGLRLSMGARL